MKRLIAYLSILIFVILAQAQFKFEVTQEIKKKEAEITITGKTFDEVWKATTRALMSLKFRVKESDKEGGTIFALKRKGLFYEFGDSLSGWNVMIEKMDDEVIIFCVYNSGSSNPLSGGKKAFKKLHKKIRERLSE